MTTRTLAVVGAAGGVGTTRLTLESAATLARTGRDVAVFDAAFDTQGLAGYVEGRIDADVTALVTDDADLEAALYDLPVEAPGRLAVCPARAPFERLARAKTAGAAREFDGQLAAAALSYDAVVVDTPPVGGNQAVAAVDAADSVAVVTTATPRGRDALALMRDRLADLGAGVDAVIANRSAEETDDADVPVPESDATAPRACPACVDPEGAFAPAVARAVECALDTTLDLEFPDGGRLDGLLGG